MANSSDGARWRRSFSDMVSLGGAAIAPLRRELAVLLSALSDNAQAAFARHFDGGYDPSAIDGPGQRGDGGNRGPQSFRRLWPTPCARGRDRRFCASEHDRRRRPKRSREEHALEGARRDRSANGRPGHLRRSCAPSPGLSAAAGRTRPRLSDHGRLNSSHSAIGEISVQSASRHDVLPRASMRRSRPSALKPSSIGK